MIWFLIFVFVLQAWGVNVTALITGLGIGGIAIALAVQNILADLFASLSIIFDKPFLVGDYLTIDDYRGTVEEIGLKTTKLRSVSGEQLVFSNSDLLRSRIRNYGRMVERRGDFNFGIVYETDPDVVAQIPGWVEGDRRGAGDDPVRSVPLQEPGPVGPGIRNRILHDGS